MIVYVTKDLRCCVFWFIECLRVCLCVSQVWLRADVLPFFSIKTNGLQNCCQSLCQPFLRSVLHFLLQIVFFNPPLVTLPTYFIYTCPPTVCLKDPGKRLFLLSGLSEGCLFTLLYSSTLLLHTFSFHSKMYSCVLIYFLKFPGNCMMKLSPLSPLLSAALTEKKERKINWWICFSALPFCLSSLFLHLLTNHKLKKLVFLSPQSSASALYGTSPLTTFPCLHRLFHFLPSLTPLSFFSAFFFSSRWRCHKGMRGPAV